ncbi:MAG: helix-turn-helix transcriptional regulator [Sphingomonas sp.]|nr:helix-turn-helix transcriptional regulator [Sphingomonas sp.]
MPKLTERQLQCLRGFAERKTAKVIGRELGISHHAVEQHLKAARRKLGAADTLEAARRYFGGGGTTAKPYYDASELSFPGAVAQFGDQPTQSVASLRDIAADEPEILQPLPPSLTLLVIGACGVAVIVILALIVAVAEGVGQLAQ